MKIDTTTSWYAAKSGNHQGLIIDENTGKNIAVVYEKTDAPLIANAPDLLLYLKLADLKLKSLGESDPAYEQIIRNAEGR